MTGAVLDATAYTEAQTGAQVVLDIMAATVGGNIKFLLLIAGISAGLMVVKFIFRRYTNLHRG